MTDKQYLYSEIFHSAQGEGLYTGTPGPWLRYFMCNLQCNGFGQKDPTDESTYVLPYKDLDTSKYDKLEDLPVFEFGCDSSYSWSRKFKGLQHKGTAKEIYNRLIDSRISRILAGVNLKHVKEKLILHANSKKMHEDEHQYISGIDREKILEDLQFASIFHNMKAASRNGGNNKPSSDD